MSAAEKIVVGLRERKKIRTRAAIRDNAMRLFQEQGYGATTIDQIAEAADVSSSTFFRYFPTKEAVVLTDDLDPIVVAAVEAMPPEMSGISAIRQALTGALGDIDAEMKAFESARQRLIATEPELRVAMVDDFRRNVELIAGVMAKRTGRDPESVEVKVFAGAVIGALLAAVSSTGEYRVAVDQALGILEAGWTL